MPAYLLFIREGAVRDPAELDLYSRKNRESPRDPKLTPLVVYGAIEALEGAPPDGVVLLQFPTAEDAKAWYHSPGYQAAIPHRKKAADYRAILIQGLQEPVR
jgi:uncharacterized protein (DUF1330 family)